MRCGRASAPTVARWATRADSTRRRIVVASTLESLGWARPGDRIASEVGIGPLAACPVHRLPVCCWRRSPGGRIGSRKTAAGGELAGSVWCDAGVRYAGQPVHILAGNADRPAGFAAMEITVPAHFAGRAATGSLPSGRNREGLSTVARPPACYRASWQLPGPDFHRQATTSL